METIFSKRWGGKGISHASAFASAVAALPPSLRYGATRWRDKKSVKEGQPREFEPQMVRMGTDGKLGQLSLSPNPADDGG